MIPTENSKAPNLGKWTVKIALAICTIFILVVLNENCINLNSCLYSIFLKRDFIMLGPNWVISLNHYFGF